LNTSAMFSSATDDWATPQWLFDELNAEFGFKLDACATAENAKCGTWYDRETDALKADWSKVGNEGPGAVWCNPPYGRVIGLWVDKARETAKQGRTVVCLLPARTDTRWFHDHIHNQAEIRFLRGRLKFGGSKNSAPFPSMIVVFR
jgi:phage N-6-adenine-methyltransferase